jgi:hypothetical protein
VSLVPVRVVADHGDDREFGQIDFARLTGGGQTGNRDITVELTPGQNPAAAIRVRIPPGCDEESIRRVLRATTVLTAGGTPAAAEGPSPC